MHFDVASARVVGKVESSRTTVVRQLPWSVHHLIMEFNIGVRYVFPSAANREATKTGPFFSLRSPLMHATIRSGSKLYVQYCDA